MKTEWDSAQNMPSEMPGIIWVLHDVISRISFSLSYRVWGFNYPITLPHTKIRSLKSIGSSE